MSDNESNTISPGWIILIIFVIIAVIWFIWYVKFRRPKKEVVQYDAIEHDFDLNAPFQGDNITTNSEYLFMQNNIDNKQYLNPSLPIPDQNLSMQNVFYPNTDSNMTPEELNKYIKDEDLEYLHKETGHQDETLYAFANRYYNTMR